MLTLAGCGEQPECKTSADCPSTHCKIGMCVQGSCHYDIKDNCCGNGRPEALEDGKQGNRCTCPQDYGACEVPASLHDVAAYFSASCTKGTSDGSECKIDMNTTAQKEIKIQGSVTDNIKFDIIGTLMNPFNERKNLLVLTFKVVDIPSLVKNPQILSITLKGYDQKDRTENIILDKEINRHLWFVGDEIKVSYPLSFKTSDIVTSFMRLTLFLRYSYEINGQKIINTFQAPVTSISYSNPFVLVNPPKDVVYTEEDCPGCDDNNPGTKDYCPEGMAYCINEPIVKPGYYVKGNYICEPGENKCTSPLDCGPCKGDYSDYLYYGCKQQQCNLLINPKNYQSNLALLSDPQTLYGMTLQFELDLPQPADITKDSLKFFIKGKQFDVNMLQMPIEIVEITLKDENNQRIASQTYTKNNKIRTIGDTLVVTFPLQQYSMVDVEKKTSISYEVRVRFYQIVQGINGLTTQENYATFTNSFRNLVFVKPGPIEE